MGVDHGLGGRDGKKSKDRRLKRSKKNKVIATKALRGGSNKFIWFLKLIYSMSYISMITKVRGRKLSLMKQLGQNG